MLLTDLHNHFNNCNVYHAYELPTNDHVVYKNHTNDLIVVLPKEEFIPNEFALLACGILGIEPPPPFMVH